MSRNGEIFFFNRCLNHLLETYYDILLILIADIGYSSILIDHRLICASDANNTWYYNHSVTQSTEALLTLVPRSASVCISFGTEFSRVLINPAHNTRH